MPRCGRIIDTSSLGPPYDLFLFALSSFPVNGRKSRFSITNLVFPFNMRPRIEIWGHINLFFWLVTRVLYLSFCRTCFVNIIRVSRPFNYLSQLFVINQTPSAPLCQFYMMPPGRQGKTWLMWTRLGISALCTLEPQFFYFPWRDVSIFHIAYPTALNSSLI